MGAEKPGVAALHAKGPDTIAAESLLAFGALDDRGDAGVQEASERSVEEMSLDRLRFGFQLGDGDADRVWLFFQIHSQFRGAEAQDLPVLKNGLLDGLPINEGAIGGIEIADKDGIPANDEFAMETGDRRVVNPVIVGRISTEAGKAIGEFKGSRVGNPG
jgi:hypothetical protein